MSDVLDLSAELAAPAATSPVVAACLRLCQASYQPLDEIAADVGNMPPVYSPGKWRVLWGPAEDGIEANLAVVAGFYLDTAPSRPFLVAVGIRGTDVDVDNPCGVAYQVWEDMDAAFQTSFSYTGGYIASGTDDALEVIQGLTDPATGQTLGGFLNGFYSQPTPPRAPLLVTGHSLGGCLTTVVVPWLKAMLAQTPAAPNVAGYTFAAPSAGNQDFANGLAKVAAVVSVRNSLDVATLAWVNFAGMKTLYAAYGLDAPLYVRAAIDFFEGELAVARATYAQPSLALPLTGAFDLNNAASWPDQALFQHHTTTYAALLGLPAVDTPREAGSRRKRRPLLGARS